MHHKSLDSKYRVQLLKEDYCKQLTFYHKFNDKLGNDDTLVRRLLLSEETTFYINAKSKDIIVKFQGYENPNQTIEHKKGLS